MAFVIVLTDTMETGRSMWIEAPLSGDSSD